MLDPRMHEFSMTWSCEGKNKIYLSSEKKFVFAGATGLRFAGRSVNSVFS